MKFLCDRCSTRYSIGDDRVRGKILKIRCKNCANVITVREGMSADLELGQETSPEVPARAKKTTTIAPAALEEREPASASSPSGPSGTRDPLRSLAPRPTAKEVPTQRLGPARPSAAQAPPAAAIDAGRPGLSGGGVRGAVPAPRLEPAAAPPSKPPPALEEEWYVSIDGDQAGPFSLAEAQRWVAQKPFDTELHCWSEGFDDWLPVDKVSHFRGLRKRPVTGAPPLPGPGLHTPRPAMSAPPGPSDRHPAIAAEDEPRPLFAATMASIERAAPSRGPGLEAPPPARATPPTGLPARSAQPVIPAGAMPLGARPLGAPFDVSEGSDGETQLEAPPFDPAARPWRPAAEAKPAAMAPEPTPGSSDAALTTPALPAAGAPGGSGGDDELDIGEVSRVVKLADLVRTPRPEPVAAVRRGGTGAVGRLTGAAPSLRSTAAVPALSDPASAGGESAVPAEADAGQAIAPIATSHRRGLIALLGVAGVMVLGVVGAVVLFVNQDETTGGHLGSVRSIDTSRPEDPITHRPIDPQTAPAPQNPLAPRPTQPRPPRVATPPTGSSREPEVPAGGTLDSTEIEDAARKHQDVTQRCYMRAQRGADSILIGDVKKIMVTLTVGKDGNVSDVQLSDHGGDNLGKCLIGSIRGWKFRPSAGGTFRISLNFVNG